MNQKYQLVKNTAWKEVEVNGEMVEIPEDWAVKKILDITNSIGRGQSPSYIENANTCVVGQRCLSSYQLDWTKSRTCLPMTGSKGQFKKGDVLVASTGSGTLGKMVIADKEGYCDTHITVLKFNDFFGSLFYFWGIKNFDFINTYWSQGGTNQIELKKDLVAAHETSYPPLNEQKAIASLLESQQNLIASYDSLIAQQQKRLDYLSDELLSGRIRLQGGDKGEPYTMVKNTKWKEVEVNGEMVEIPEDWETNKLDELFNIFRGKVISKDYINNNTGPYPVYSSATENNGSIGCIGTYMFDGEYLTWTTDGVYAGTVFYRSGKFNCTNICGLLKPKCPMNLKGLSYFVKNELPLHVNHIGNSKLMSNAVQKIGFFYPPFSEQTAIANVLTQQEKLIEQYRTLRDLEQKRFAWLSDALLSGTYRVKELQ